MSLFGIFTLINLCLLIPSPNSINHSSLHTKYKTIISLKLASNGCPNEGGYRSLIWKILLNYLPLDRNKWNEILTRRRNEYREFVREVE